MLRSCLLAAILALLTHFAIAQEITQTAPNEVGVCDLRHNPKAYDGHLVRVSGTVTYAFEDFEIAAAECASDDQDVPVWLMYGGDEADSAIYCCGSHARQQGQDVKINGHVLPLTRDARFREFRDRISATRMRRPDGVACIDECKFYRVSATFVGTFFAKNKSPSDPFSGYGHFGCCSLLVIQSVLDVSAERTDVPLGEFQCASEDWNPSSKRAASLKLLRECDAPADGDCDRYLEEAIAQVAAHWKDAVDPQKKAKFEIWGGHVSNWTATWLSSDLLTSYTAQKAPQGAQAQQFERITRISCKPSADRAVSLSPQQRVACDQRTVSAFDAPDFARRRETLLNEHKFRQATSELADHARTLFSRGDQSWRTGNAESAADYLLHLQLGLWHVNLNSELQFDKCSMNDESPDLGLFANCLWFTRDGLQEFGVTLLKFKDGGVRDNDRSVPWVVIGVDERSCNLVQAELPESDFARP